jgi:hypothetical protein
MMSAACSPARRAHGLIGALLLGALATAACSSTDDSTPTAPPIDGGVAVCDETSITTVIRDEVDETYPGATFVSLADYECVNGWAVARAEVDTSGVIVPAAFFLRAEGQFWIPESIEEICDTSLADSPVPEAIYAQACDLPD